MMKEITVYIGGKVSGQTPEEYHAKFEAARQWLLDLAYCIWMEDNVKVIIPMDLCQDDWNWFKCMEVCASMLMQCDVLYLLPDWKESHGATAEYYIAKAANIQCVEIDEKQWNEIQQRIKK